jgi:tetratricopeptide (TPR) repeat protein
MTLSSSSSSPTSLLSALCSLTLSASLALGSAVALAAPPAEEPPPPETPDGTVDTGSTEAEKDEASGLSDQAIEKFQAKDYEGAVALFEQAYSIDPAPNYLFNIGRVYEEAGNLEKAVEFYAKFVKQPGVDLDSRGVALDRLKVLRSILEETAEKPPEEKPEEKPEPVVEQPPPEPVVDQDAQRKRKAMRGAGFGLLGVGAAALIGGGVAGGLAQGDHNKAGEVADPADGVPLLDSSQTKSLAANVLFGVGGAFVLTGVILVAVGFSKPKPTSRVALAPSFGPRGGGVTFRLRF